MNLQDIEPATIVRAQSGDAAARHSILACVASWVPRAAALRYPAHRGRDDLCQEVLLQVHLGLERIEQPERFEAWVYGVLRNCTYSRYRSDRRDRSEPTEHIERAQPSPDNQEPPRTPEDISADAEAWRRGMSAIDGLSPKLREVYALYLEEHSFGEIADLLELPRGTVASRLRTAQALVRRRLGVVSTDKSSPQVHHFPQSKGG